MKDDIQRYRDNLRDELNGAALYAALAAAETDPLRKDLFLQLAQAESSHAQLWRDKLTAAGIHDERFVPGFRTRLLAKLAQRFGPKFVLPTVAAAEFADRNKYAGQSDAHAISAEERGHAAVIQAVAGNSGRGGQTGADIARAEPWHRGASGNNLRAAVLGANDGLVSNFCLVMGVAGAGSANKAVLLTGLAGLAAGACSMALGEWLSVTNARELAQTQIAREAEELEQTPLAEQHELALIFQAKGMPKEDAQRVAVNLMKDKQGALDTLAREELGIDPEELGGNAWTAAATSFVLFSAGAIFPVVPFFWMQGLLGNRCECPRQWCGSVRSGYADFSLQRPWSLVLRHSTADFRVFSGGCNLWNWGCFGHHAVMRIWSGAIAPLVVISRKTHSRSGEYPVAAHRSSGQCFGGGCRFA